VVKFGVPSQNIVQELWSKHNLITFASSANPSGIGNKGKMEGIGERIHNAADLIINGDEYVASIQPNKDIKSRYEQGVMVSLVNEKGELVDDTNATYKPRLIRKGLDCDKIMELMSEVYKSWDYRHGDYY
jgi:signal transduction protein with GAF and PtsI domain